MVQMWSICMVASNFKYLKLPCLAQMNLIFYSICMERAFRTIIRLLYLQSDQMAIIRLFCIY